MKIYPVKRGEGDQQIVYLEEATHKLFPPSTKPIKTIYVPMVGDK